MYAYQHTYILKEVFVYYVCTRCLYVYTLTDTAHSDEWQVCRLWFSFFLVNLKQISFLPMTPLSPDQYQ